MRWFSFAIILLIATLLDAGNLLNLVAFGNWSIRPGILITLLVYYALVSQPHEAISCSFLVGLAADLAGGLLGPHMLCYGLIGILLNQMNRALMMKRAIHKVLVVFFTFIIAETVSYWLGFLRTHESQTAIYSILFLTGLYSAVLSPLIWPFLSTLSGWSTPGHSRSQRAYH